MIEDAAESLEQRIKGKHGYALETTAFFHLTVTRLSPPPGGRMLVSDNEERIAKVRFWATQSRDPARHYQHSNWVITQDGVISIAGIGRWAS